MQATIPDDRPRASERVRSSNTKRAMSSDSKTPNVRKRPMLDADGRDADGARWVWPFKLKDRLGEGGMGVVYRGEYAPNGREVAVKMLPRDVSDPVILKRFEQELEILKGLKHPNIVRCFGGLCENEARFYAMELVEGGTLEEELDRRGRLPWEQCVEYGRQMAAGLQASHEKGIVHRDVKPGNFLKTPSGSLKLSDFGLARIDAGRNITRAGKTAGTVLYMAPEQIRGKEITPSADLYALGCVLYEMLSGRTPFEGDASASILHAHVTSQPPRLGSLATDCPPDLEELVHQLLEKEPENRPASAAEVGTRLDNLSQTVSVKRAAGSGVVSSVPLSTANDRTETADIPAIPAARPTPRGVPKSWMAVGLAGTVALLLFGLWQRQTAIELKAWHDEWLQLARSPGPTQPKALEVLARLGAESEEAAGVAVSAAASPDPDVRLAAVEALPKFDVLDFEIVGTLRNLAKSDDDGRVRAAAQRAIDSRGGP